MKQEKEFPAKQPKLYVCVEFERISQYQRVI